MARSLWEVFASLIKRDSEDDKEEDEKEDGRFVPSPMDLSVRFAHGGGDNEVERELNKIEKQAQELKENRHDK